MNSSLKNDRPSVKSQCLCALLCLLLGMLSGLLSNSGDTSWYQSLNQPWFTPPPWIFGPMWSVLYVLIGVAGSFLWHQRRTLMALWVIFLLQLVLNYGWSFVFFSWHQLGWAALHISVLWLLIVSFFVIACRYQAVVAWLFLPYCLWVTFAMVLNITIWQLN